MNGMPRNVFDRELERLGADLADMGRRVDVVMLDTIHCLKTMDTAAAGRVFGHDGEINAREKSIEQSCMNLIALQQPLARDLRAITATLKIITDMERIADQCADICEILSTVSGLAAFNPPPKLLEMFDKARRMFAGALDAYIRRDGKLAEAVCRSDDEVDALFSASILELCGKISQEGAAVPESVDFMFIAKYIERIADHATNVAEWAVFVETGAHPNLNDTQAGH